jgi:phage terminase small subunit
MQDPVLRQQALDKALIAGRPENRPLSFRQKKFVAEYLSDPLRNVSAALQRAGYSKNYSYNNTDIIRHPQIAAIIAEADRKVFKKLEIDHERVLQEVATIAFGNLGDYLKPIAPGSKEYAPDLSKLSVQQTSVIRDFIVEEAANGSRRTRITLYDKLSALTLLGKHLGLFNEKPAENTLTINFLDRIVQGGSPQGTTQQLSLPSGGG